MESMIRITRFRIDSLVHVKTVRRPAQQTKRSRPDAISLPLGCRFGNLVDLPGEVEILFGDPALAVG